MVLMFVVRIFYYAFREYLRTNLDALNKGGKNISCEGFDLRILLHQIEEAIRRRKNELQSG